MALAHAPVEAYPLAVLPSTGASAATCAAVPQVKMFGKEVVREPYFVAGNSIGGYTALSAAAGTGREYVKGVVLLNSAGRMLSAEEYVSELEANGGTVKVVAVPMRSAVGSRVADCLQLPVVD